MSYSTGLQPTFQNVPLLVPGVPLYVFGSKSKDIAPTSGYVTNVAGDGATATVHLQLVAGNIPVAGQLITIQGCSVSGFNTVSTAIATVSGFNTGDNSTGTITYSNATSQASIASTGAFIAPVPITADVCQNGSSIYVALPYNDPRIDQSRTLVFQANFPSLPTTATLAAEVSDDGVTFYSIGTVATVAGGVLSGGWLEVADQSAAFAQLVLSSVTGGTLPTVWGTISA